ncbi:MAG: elongation factor G [candidate division Zixibacteria bacterium]|nr:elongation factor G [candidate division Zixibacteria bacterium]
MKDFSTDKIRNLCLAGQRGCGKTSVADTVAFITGLNNRIGLVDTGTSLLDYTDTEISRKTSVTTKLMAFQWKDSKLNFFDCPGHSDFIGELLSTANVCDSVGFVINAQSNVEVGTQLQWRALEKYQIARFFFVNKMESENVDWQVAVNSIQTTFGQQAIPVQLPIGQSDTFKGIVDIISSKAYEFDTNGKAKEVDIPDDLKDLVETARNNLIEVAAEADDELTEKFLEEDTLNNIDLQKGLRLGIQKGTLFPILFGSAGKNIGIDTMLDFAISHLPSSAQISPFRAFKKSDESIHEVPFDSNGKPMAYIFKIASEGHLGEMVFFRMFSGSLTSGMELKNIQTGNTERVTQIYTMQGKNRADQTKISAGDIGILVKLKNTHVTNTLTGDGLDLYIQPVEYPNPVMDVAIKAKSKGDDDKIASGLHKLNDEDPTFKLISDPALKQMVLWGQGSTHIDVINEKLKNRFGVEVELVRPKIPYRETIRGKCETKYRHKKQSGGRGQFGEVHIRLEPNKRSGGFEFINAIKGGVIPSKFIPAVEKGIVEQMQHGGLAGAQVVDVKVTLYYGSYHEVDSSDMAFKIAGLMAFKQGFLEAKPILLEPIYNVEILVPSEFAGDVMGDMSSRRGKISGMDPEGSSQRIKVTVPQAELYKYSVNLRSMTQGQGFYTIEFSHYEEIPRDAAQKVIEEAKVQAENDD